MGKHVRQSSASKRTSKKKDNCQPDAVVVDFPRKSTPEAPSCGR